MQPRKFILQNNSRSLAIRDRVQSTRNQFSKSDIKKLVKSYFNNQKQINKKSLPSLNQNNQFPKTGAKAVFVYDYDRKVDLYKNNQYEKRQIASLTKIMTCWVAIQYIRTYDIIPEQFFVTVSNKASIMNGTTSQLQDGDKLSLWDLLHGLMLPSGNDAAICIAQVLGGKLDHGKKSKIENFVQEMNLWANHFEMKNTNYANPHGLANRNNKSTAQDQMILIRNAIEDPLFARIIDKRVYFCSVQEKDGWTRQLFWENTNRLLYRGFSGVKTGSTVPAGYCLASWYKNQNVNLLVVVLGCNSDQNRYEDTIKIIKWGIKQHSARQSLKSSHVTSLQ